MAKLQQGRLASALQWLSSCGTKQALIPAGQELAARTAEHASVEKSAAKPGRASIDLHSRTDCVEDHYRKAPTHSRDA